MVLTYNDLKVVGHLNIASVIASQFASDLTWGPGTTPADSEAIEPRIYYAERGNYDSWIKFPSTFRVYDEDDNEVSLSFQKLKLNSVSIGKFEIYTVENHAGHKWKIIIIGTYDSSDDDDDDEEPYCGDGDCNGDENSATCPADCPSGE